MSKKRMIVAVVAVIALVAILGVCLVACGKKDAENLNEESYRSKLEAAGYEVESMPKEDLVAQAGDLGGGELEWFLSAEKTGTDPSLGDNVLVAKFKTSSDADKSYEFLKRECAEYLESTDDIYKTGCIVIYGTKQGVKDAK